MPPRFVAEQLSHPSGILGVIFRQLMNRTNASLNAYALEQLAVSSGDRVLEIGFGGGLLLPRLLDRAALVCGVDRSRQAVAAANKRFATAVREGRAKFCEATIESLPFGDAQFTRVVTVNTVYFWTSLQEGFSELSRVSRPGGRAAIGFLPKEYMDRMNMPADIFTPRAPDDIIRAINDAGFRDARIRRPTAQTKWNVAVAEK
jgi:SAM-dependent methyltransferase